MADLSITEQFAFLHKKLDALQACLDTIKEAVICEVHTFAFAAFDTDSGVFADAGYVHTTTVNGTSVSTPLDPAWTTKSQAYADTVAAVNAIPGASMTLVTDAAITSNDRVQWLISYTPDNPVTIVNEHNGDTYTFGVDKGGNCVASVTDRQGNAIESLTPVEQ